MVLCWGPPGQHMRRFTGEVPHRPGSPAGGEMPRIPGVWCGGPRPVLAVGYRDEEKLDALLLCERLAARGARGGLLEQSVIIIVVVLFFMY